VADEATVVIGENSPQSVAYRLMRDIANAEGKTFGPGGVDRVWILRTYAECLLTVHNPDSRTRGL
jgi:hypothetical protein